MQLLVSDANILIDMLDGQLIEPMFRLPWTFCVPDLLFADELEEQHAHLLDAGLQQRELQAAAMQDAMELTQRYRKPSRLDCVALALARQENCTLLTGDAALRKAAMAENVTVHGTVWLVEQLVMQALINIDDAAAGYQRMQAAGSRLPWKTAAASLRGLGRAPE